MLPDTSLTSELGQSLGPTGLFGQESFSWRLWNHRNGDLPNEIYGHSCVLSQVIEVSL